MKGSNRQFHPSNCQRCGEPIGYLGRFVEFLYSPVLWAAKSIFHNCPGLFVHSAKKIPKSEGYYRGNNFPILGSTYVAPNEHSKDA